MVYTKKRLMIFNRMQIGDCELPKECPEIETRFRGTHGPAIPDLAIQPTFQDKPLPGKSHGT